MNHRAAVWTAAFLGVTATAIGMELYAANDSSADTIPWTTYIATWIPEPVTVGLIALLISWLPAHFTEAYINRRKKGSAVTSVPEPVTPDPDPAAHPDARKEPLLTVAAITTGAAAIAGLVVALGVPLTDTQQTAVLAVVAAAAPIIVGVVGRRTVYSPRTVARLVAAERANAGPTPPDDVMPGL